MKKIKFKKITEIFNNQSIDYNSVIDSDDYFTSINSISNASNQELTFFSNKIYLNQLLKTNAKACLINSEYVDYLPKSCKPILVEKPYYALACISEIFLKQEYDYKILKNNRQFQESKLIDQTCKISPNVTINSNSTLKEKVVIGANTNIGPNVIINKNTVIQDNVSISRVMQYDSAPIPKTRLRAKYPDSAKKNGDMWEIFTHGGRNKTGINAIEFAKKMEKNGAGELLVTSMDKDGTQSGYDIELMKNISSSVNIPVIASGGVGTLDHLVDGIKSGANAVLAASIFHYGTFSIEEAKQYLASKDIPVRI